MHGHQPHGIGLDAVDRGTGLDLGGVLQVLDVIEEAAQVASFARFEPAREAQQLVYVRKPSLSPIESEHVLAVAGRLDYPLDQLRQRPARSGAALTLQQSAEGEDPVAIAWRHA